MESLKLYNLYFISHICTCCYCLVTQSCLTLCDLCGLQHTQLPVLHYILEFAQTHVHWVSDAVQLSHPLLPLLLLSSCISFLPEPLETLHKISSIVFNSLLHACVSQQHISLMSKTDRRKEKKCCPIFFFPSMLLLSVFSSVQSLSRVRLFVTPWIAACQASLSITNSQNLLKLLSIESVMPPNHHLQRYMDANAQKEH